MPAPHPPSKSYLLVISDSDLEDSDNESQKVACVIERQESFHTSETARASDSPSEQSYDDLPPQVARESNVKKSKRKKKKKGKRNKQTVERVDEERKDTLPKHVHFSTISTREFPRSLGYDVVPGDGGWPLGLSLDTYIDVPNVLTVDMYEIEKQQRLQALWKEVFPADDHSNLPEYLETRQWDYRRKVRNPLFGMIHEKERMAILLNKETGTEESKHPNADKKKHHPQHQHATRSQPLPFCEHFNEIFTQVQVHHVRNELEQIRFERTKEGSAGCTCRKLQVYIPPQGAGKKAAHRRLKIHRVKEELQKRNRLPEQQCTREELELLLHDIVNEEPCCGPDCFCTRNGIVCQADTCACWLSSHQADKKKELNSQPTVAEIQKRCGNKYGIYTVDFDSINAYREKFLCRPIKSYD